MIEDGDADFERIHHAHAVNFGEEVADHISFGIDVEKLAERIMGGAVGKVAAESAAGIVAAAQNVTEAIGEQRQVAFKTGDERKLIDVTLLPGKRNVVGESASAHGAGHAAKDLIAKHRSEEHTSELQSR